MSIGTIIFGLFLDMFHSEEDKTFDQMTIQGYLFALGPTISIPFIVCFSKFYVNANSLDQIIFGNLLGLWIASTMHFCFKD